MLTTSCWFCRLTSQYSQKDQSVWSKDHPVASSVYSPLRGWVYLILIWRIFCLFSPDVAAAELFCRRRGNLWPCFSSLIHKQMEVFGSDLPKLIQPQTQRACSSRVTSGYLFVPLVPYFSSGRTCWMGLLLECTRHPACAQSHISSAAPHSMPNVTRVKNMCLSGDKTSLEGNPCRCMFTLILVITTVAVWWTSSHFTELWPLEPSTNSQSFICKTVN